MHIVLDTNVIISALLFGGAPERVVLSTLGGEHTAVLSPYIIEETSRILYAKFGIHSDTLYLLQRLLTQADVVYFQPFLHVISDEPDNRILETAVRGQAACIVTGDKLLLSLRKYKNIQIIKPADFLYHHLDNKS